MAVSDYSTTPGSNTSISGINIAENCSPANINNSIRQLMADIKTFYDTVNAGGDYQPIDPTLTALAGVTTAANKLIYATGSDAFSTTDLTGFARTILDDADAATVRSTIGAMSEPAVSGTSSSGKIAIGPITLAWRDHSVTGGTSASYAYGGGHTYTSWAKAWMAGDDAVSNVSFAVTSWGLSSAVIFNNSSNPTTSCVLFSIGV